MSLLTTKEISDKIGISERTMYYRLSLVKHKVKKIKKHSGNYYTREEAKKIVLLLGYSVRI